MPSVAEQADVSFVQPLGAPDELTVGAADAEKLSVRAVILVRIGIPPRPTGSLARESTFLRPGITEGEGVSGEGELSVTWITVVGRIDHPTVFAQL